MTPNLKLLRHKELESLQLINDEFCLLSTCVALLLDRCEGPTAMLTLDEDCVSVVFPPSAADSPEITRPLEKLRFPNSKLSVDEDEETWAVIGLT